MSRGWKLALDIAKGLHYLHSRNIIHMDLKTPNVLLTAEKDHAKISDFGLAELTPASQQGSDCLSAISQG